MGIYLHVFGWSNINVIYANIIKFINKVLYTVYVFVLDDAKNTNQNFIPEFITIFGRAVSP